jgi:NAD(P)-dependent dehydrogenase (short-subunit alcohol dehydrogenase family)
VGANYLTDVDIAEVEDIIREISRTYEGKGTLEVAKTDLSSVKAVRKGVREFLF